MFHKITARITTIAATFAGAMMIVMMLLLAACGNDRRTENNASETKNAETTQTADAETETQANDVAVVADQQFNHDINYDIFIDPRDNQTYRIVRIGNLTWLAQNLNHQTENSWCYDNDDSNCEKFGRLYNWNAAMSACPAGWRLPSDGDWDDLMIAVGGRSTAGRMLKSTTGWDGNRNGTDDYGFSALPGGARWSNGRFSSVGSYGYWWGASEARTTHARYRFMHYHNIGVYASWSIKEYASSVRCVRD